MALHVATRMCAAIGVQLEWKTRGPETNRDGVRAPGTVRYWDPGPPGCNGLCESFRPDRRSYRNLRSHSLLNRATKHARHLPGAYAGSRNRPRADEIQHPLAGRHNEGPLVDLRLFENGVSAPAIFPKRRRNDPGHTRADFDATLRRRCIPGTTRARSKPTGRRTRTL